MSTYTAFLASVRPGTPYWDGMTYTPVLQAEVTMLDAAGNMVPAWGTDDQQLATVTVQSVAGLVPTDTVASARDKISAVLRTNWPNVDEADMIKCVWLDGGALVSV